MPHLKHKNAIAAEIRKTLLPELHDLVLGDSDTNRGLIGRWYTDLRLTLGAMELAYRRGVQAGREAERRGSP